MVEKLSPPFTTEFPNEWYDDNLEGHFWFAWRRRILQQMLEENRVPTQAPWRGLEIGGGVGFFRQQVEGMTRWTVDAADLNEPALEKAGPSRGQTLLYNIEDRRAELKEHYDVLFLFDVLEHIRHPLPFLEAALWHLKPGGLLVINVPALPRLYSRYDELVGHFMRYTAASMRQTLGSVSTPLKIRDTRYWGFSLLPVAWLRKVMVQRCQTPQQAVATGFNLSKQWIHRGFRAAMRFETSILHHPPAGTSLMVLAIKE